MPGRRICSAAEAKKEETQLRLFLDGLKSGLSIATQNIDQLMLDQFLDGTACGLQIFTRIELAGILAEELTAALRSCSSGTPTALGMLPPFSLIIFTKF